VAGAQKPKGERHADMIGNVMQIAAGEEEDSLPALARSELWIADCNGNLVLPANQVGFDEALDLVGLGKPRSTTEGNPRKGDTFEPAKRRARRAARGLYHRAAASTSGAPSPFRSPRGEERVGVRGPIPGSAGAERCGDGGDGPRIPSLASGVERVGVGERGRIARVVAEVFVGAAAILHP
jgi:hypothetical protein